VSHPAAGIESILAEELQIYTALYGLEEKKGAAIMDRNGSLIESLSMEQERLLERVATLEDERMRRIEELVARTHLKAMPREASLRDILPAMDGDCAHRLRGLGGELRRLTRRLESLYLTNRQLIEDNLKFFNILLSGLKNTVSVNTGYSEKGVEKSRVAGALLLNTQA
jgi:hypothetical protein